MISRSEKQRLVTVVGLSLMVLVAMLGEYFLSNTQTNQPEAKRAYQDHIVAFSPDQTKRVV